MDRSNEYDSHASLDDLVDRVERGEEVVVSRGGEAVAKLTPLVPAPHPRSRSEIDRAVDNLINFRKRYSVTGSMTIEEIIAAKEHRV